jgi:hypothetical protein
LSPWTPERVLDAATVMEWQPDDAIEVRTDDYRLIRYPDWALDPSFPAAQVTRSRSGRPVGDLIEEVLAYVRGWGLLGVAWWVSAASRPADTEEQLRARGGKRIDAVQILARELTEPLPELGVPADVSEAGTGRSRTRPPRPRTSPKRLATSRPGPTSACWPA